MPSPAALSDGEMDDAVVAAEHPPVEVDDLARAAAPGPQPLDHIGIMSARHEADVLAVLFVGDRKTVTPRQLPRFRLGPIAERKTQEIELGRRGGKQKIALVALGFAGAVSARPPPGKAREAT